LIRFDEILGQRPALEILTRMLATGRVPHALLLQGPEGVGKGTVARAVGAALLCESRSAREPEDGIAEACGACTACKLVAHGSHPDLLVVERLPKKQPPASRGDAAPPAPGDLRSFILVDQIRQVSQFAALSPRQGRRRVFIIDPADRMNTEAQNALLKTLEEPPGRAVLMLVASRPQLLLTTVRSRTFNISFGPLRTAELATLLRERGMPEQEALARAALAEGRPGRALGLDLDELLERRHAIMDTLETLTSSRAAIAEIPEMAAALAGTSEAHLLAGLELLETLLRDAAVSDAARDHAALAHGDLADRLARVGRSLGAARAAAILAALESLRNDLRVNVNRTLLAETLLAAIAGGPIP
jgi:DNA polymerase-3 subunit delta'